MHPLNAYKQQQNRSMTRIELILTMYRKAMDNLGRARQALVEGRPDAGRSFRLNVQMIVWALSSDLPVYKDETSINFLRLYEFVARKMTVGTVESIDAAVTVLRPLQEGFEAVREQALLLEQQGAIPPLEQSRHVSLSA